MKKLIYWRCEVFDHNFYFAYGYKPEELQDHVRKLYKNKDLAFEPGHFCEGCCVEFENKKLKRGATWIWIRQWAPKTLDEIRAWTSVLSHECTHAAWQVMWDKGFEVNRSNETLAYLQGTLVRVGLGG